MYLCYCVRLAQTIDMRKREFIHIHTQNTIDHARSNDFESYSNCIQKYRRACVFHIENVIGSILYAPYICLAITKNTYTQLHVLNRQELFNVLSSARVSVRPLSFLLVRSKQKIYTCKAQQEILTEIELFNTTLICMCATAYGSHGRLIFIATQTTRATMIMRACIEKC